MSDLMLPRAGDAQHIFTVDVEEHFQVSAFEGHVDRRNWDRFASRVEQNTHALMSLLEEHRATATFFVLGWIGERHPGLVREIADAGHEVATHGLEHRRVSEMAPADFREDIRRAKGVLEEVTGRAVLGHRAASFSITPGHEWAFDILLEEGLRYDSSLFPIRRAGYGYPNAHPGPHLIRRESGTLLELPLATIRWSALRLPAAGGAYLRLLPFAVTRRAFSEHSENGKPAVFYVHPWELDPDQPRLAVSNLARFRHYTGLDRTEPRVRELLQEFTFTSVADMFDLSEIGLGQSAIGAISYS